jgi:hypothetical protein
MKKIRITHSYCYLDFPDNNSAIVDMWFIMGLPFTFEEIPVAVQELEEVKLDADTGRRYTMEEIYKISDYLIAEEAHPILFDLSWLVENYAEIPD